MGHGGWCMVGGAWWEDIVGGAWWEDIVGGAWWVGHGGRT